MIEKIDKIRELLIVPSVDEQPKLAINQMKILNLLVELRNEAEQLTIPAVVRRSEQLVCPNCGNKSYAFHESTNMHDCLSCEHEWAN